MVPEKSVTRMCLLLIAVDATPEFPLLVLGNRDEFHARASASAQPWVEDERVVGGRDLVAGGTWLALHSDGRFAAVTNLRTGVPATAPRSRGWLCATSCSAMRRQRTIWTRCARRLPTTARSIWSSATAPACSRSVAAIVSCVR